MKISYNGTQVKETKYRELVEGQAFSYESWYYITISISCKGLAPAIQEGKRPAVNLHSGTTRLIPLDAVIVPLDAKAVLRDKVMHNKED